MNQITHRETIEDYVLMAHAYGKTMGEPAALDKAEATINERRGDLLESGEIGGPEYSLNIRENVTVLFMRADCKGPGDYFMTARDMEAGWWELFRKAQ